MRIEISHNLSKPLVLPLAYQSILQSIIYRNIRDSEEFGELHDEGYQYEKRQFRLFTFSNIFGQAVVYEKNIIFYNKAKWFLSGNNDNFVLNVKRHMEENGIDYLKQHINDIVCKEQNNQIETDDLIINMISPMVAYQTDEVTRKKIYYSPSDEEFYRLIHDNFVRKYFAYYNKFPESTIDLEPINVNSKDKRVTKFKGIYMTGYKGVYRLFGKKENLNFLYNAGLGSNNSQGFGMFEIMD